MNRKLFQNEIRKIVPELNETQLEKLFLYAELLQEVAYALGLSNLSREKDILEKHLLDSLMLLPHLPEGSFCDLGSGAGLPGIPLKIVRPETEAYLVDSRRKAVSFLEYAAARLGLERLEILKARVEAPEVPREYFTAVVSRAVTALSELWDLACPLLRPGGKLLALKGPRGREEVEALQERHPKLPIRSHPYELPCGRPGTVVEVLKSSPS
ncbi:MAG TPA: 16S rRNA (guanine(527)-N(7))-methyltransferase RsmG [Thermodesulfobacteriaceae bacterium]|nr:16S rRNA (guanine(527)-N(7))-methyltransferase RsmG [Thermodesulfobacteriaceae bacterium]